MSEYAQILGIIAAVGGAFVFFPQVLKVIKTKHTKDLSLIMYILVALNNLTWIAYAFAVQERAILLAQTLIFPMGLIILFYKIRYK